MKWMNSSWARLSVATRTAGAVTAALLTVTFLVATVAACANPAAETTGAEEAAAEDANDTDDPGNGDAPADEETSPPAAPQFDPAGGDFETAPEITLSTGSADATIRYTLDGTDPTKDSEAYTDPILLPSSREPIVLTARAFLEGSDAGAASAEEYRIARGPVLELLVEGTGTVTAQPDESAYLWDEEVALTAAPGIGAQFLEWSGAIAGSEVTTTLVMEASKSVTAHFAPIEAPAGLTHSLRGGIVINEILPDPTGSTTSFDTDGSGTAADADEFIELYNAGTASIDLAGLTVWDAGYGDWFVFPPDSVVDAGGVALLVAGVQDGGSLATVADGSMAFDAGRSGSVMNNSRDNLVISDPETGRYIHLLYNGDTADAPLDDYDGFPADATLMDSVEDWGNDLDGASLARFPDGTGVPEIHSEGGNEDATPGIRNAQP
ncbi:MAG: hypothetical protein GVY29_06440 [Spirochaetes bacterium]|jgi:hypothetical protein|nr:hypothetical protein [Spirochaetota bacterium]